MSYDPSKDEPFYSSREVEEVIERVIAGAFKAGWETALDSVASLPLEVYGRWEQGRVYAPSSLVFHVGRQWLSTMQTAAEPSDDTGAWRAVHLPGTAEPA